MLITDTRLSTVEIRENHEEMIDLIHQTIIAYGPSPEIPNNTDYTKMRTSVYGKLVEAQSLLPDGLKFCLYEGYRSPSLQKLLFENRLAMIKKLHPLWPYTDTFNEAAKMVAPVVNLDGSLNIPPHSTGAAIDVYLVNAVNEPIDMGILISDWMQDEDGSLSATNSTKISSSAIKHREIMNNALSSVGFVNYPNEYWHWSYGDRYWALATKNRFAVYNTLTSDC